MGHAQHDAGRGEPGRFGDAMKRPQRPRDGKDVETTGQGDMPPFSQPIKRSRGALQFRKGRRVDPHLKTLNNQGRQRRGGHRQEHHREVRATTGAGTPRGSPPARDSRSCRPRSLLEAQSRHQRPPKGLLHLPQEQGQDNERRRSQLIRQGGDHQRRSRRGPDKEQRQSRRLAGQFCQARSRLNSAQGPTTDR